MAQHHITARWAAEPIQVEVVRGAGFKPRAKWDVIAEARSGDFEAEESGVLKTLVWSQPEDELVFPDAANVNRSKYHYTVVAVAQNDEPGGLGLRGLGLYNIVVSYIPPTQ